jgi:3-isopropylmalate/(R)-2-methylmalate dehydratase small subunit
MVPTKVIFSPMEVILQNLLLELKPEFPKNVRPGDILAAGTHFGQSSGRAIAPKAIKAAGIAVVVAESFARTFLRNAYEAGLPLIECPGAGSLAKDGDTVVVDLHTGKIVNETSGKELQGEPIQPFLLSMLEAGGIIPLVKGAGNDLSGLAK